MCSREKIMEEMAKFHQQSNTECEENGNISKQSPPVTTPQMTDSGSHIEGQCSSHPPDMSSDDEDIRLILEVSSDEYVPVDESVPVVEGKKVLGVSSRKWKRQHSKWKRNIRKQLKAHGKEYVTVIGSIVAAKCLKAPYETAEKEVAEPIPEIITYRKAALGLKKVRVIIVKKRMSGTGVAPEDARGRHTNHLQVPECDKDIIRKHIKMFPAYVSIYSRAHTQKLYENPDLSIAKMFRLYQDYCKEQSVLLRNEELYCKIFVEEFNL
ncbi:hypothetical protein PR048_011060 [Dryococelus australis]|uniref:Uncharacterized protein n=1 Tax=Dryococelus australis TaxID=614101 RepID=A0ABQ9HKK5_9NEOP|nr:hypothetical protein PR048_011060 [Dryococelus australis]